MKHFEEFLTNCMGLGHTQVKLVPRIDEHGKVAFYAVGQGGPVSGDTFDAIVEGKHVRRVEADVSPSGRGDEVFRDGVKNDEVFDDEETTPEEDGWVKGIAEGE